LEGGKKERKIGRKETGVKSQDLRNTFELGVSCCGLRAKSRESQVNNTKKEGEILKSRIEERKNQRGKKTGKAPQSLDQCEFLNVNIFDKFRKCGPGKARSINWMAKKEGGYTKMQQMRRKEPGCKKKAIRFQSSTSTKLVLGDVRTNREMPEIEVQSHDELGYRAPIKPNYRT